MKKPIGGFIVMPILKIEYVNSLSGGSQLKDTLKKYIKETLASK